MSKFSTPCAKKYIEEFSTELGLLGPHFAKTKKDDGAIENLVLKDPKAMRRESGFWGMYSNKLSYFVDGDAVRTDQLDIYIECPRLKHIRDEGTNHKCYGMIAYADMKAFKPFNDYMTESAGDEIIAFILSFLSDRLTPQGFLVMRKGLGDEFLAYHMSNPIEDCKTEWEDYLSLGNIGPNAFQFDSGESDRKSIHTLMKNILESLGEQVMRLYIPKEKGKGIDSLYRLFHYGSVEGDPKSDDWKLEKKDGEFTDEEFFNSAGGTDKYRMSIFITGLEFRTGVDSTADKAEENSKDDKTTETTRRGDFSPRVMMGLKVKEADDKKNNIMWFDPSKTIILAVTGNDKIDRINRLEKLKNVINGFIPSDPNSGKEPCETLADYDFEDVSYLVVSFGSGILKRENEKYGVLDAALTYIDQPHDLGVKPDGATNLKIAKVIVERLDKYIEAVKAIRDTVDNGGQKGEQIGDNKVIECTAAIAKKLNDVLDTSSDRGLLDGLIRNSKLLFAAQYIFEAPQSEIKRIIGDDYDESKFEEKINELAYNKGFNSRHEVIRELKTHLKLNKHLFDAEKDHPHIFSIKGNFFEVEI